MNQNPIKKRLQILHLEDSPMDADLIYEYLCENARYEVQMDVVLKEDEFVAALSSKKYDLILADFMLPGFDGFVALEHVESICPSTPFICVSGFIGEEKAVELLKRGATDYVSKDKLGRLVYSIERALKETKETEEKTAQTAELQRVQLLLTASLESPKDMIILLIDQNYNYYYFNKAHKVFMKSAYDKEVAFGMNHLEAITSERNRIKAKFNFDLALKGQSHSTIQQYGTKAISYLETFYNPIINDCNEIVGATAFAIDVTERERAEAVLQRQVDSQALLLEISNNFNKVLADDIDDIITTTLRMIGELDHSDRSYIFLFSDDRSTIRNTHQWCAEGISAVMDSVQGLPWVMNLQSEYILRVADLPPEAQTEKEILLAQSIQSLIVVPMFVENKLLGFLGLDSVRGEKTWSDDDIIIFKLVAQIISIAMLRQQFARDAKTSLKKMRRILMQAVTSLGATLSIKDPYTAGHQRRVARLAAAIAEEMGLSNEQIEGIQVTGSLHDIGKINVPSEILNKPGNLSDIEFALIKTHPRAGYEIVKDIEFPWPVAEVILQHHERMDGSGYPRGLSSEAILMEARIMAVADVVEAMASYRPYRPALGIDAALDEIVQNRGIFYDPDVVAACLKMFREKYFKLE